MLSWRLPKSTDATAQRSLPIVAHRRNVVVALGLTAILAIAVFIMSSAVWKCAMALVVALASVILFRGERWRVAGLLMASIAAGLFLITVAAGWLLPTAPDQGLRRIAVPDKWLTSDPALGYRLTPNTSVLVTATFGNDMLFRVYYTIGANGNRITPPAPIGADTYLFMGDSFVFGNALADGESLPAQFADANGFRVKTINLGVPGYAPNHLVRAFEAGLLDVYADKSVKAVVTWIIPAQLERVTGDASWLSSSPRYVFTENAPRFAGNFSSYRWNNPVAGAAYFGREQLPILGLLGQQQRQQHQADLFVALMARLQQLVREKLGAPLVVLYSWPDEESHPNYSDSSAAQPFLVATLGRIRALGIPLVSVNRLIIGLPLSQILIPHDGHPTAHLNHLAAGSLLQTLGELACCLKVGPD